MIRMLRSHAQCELCYFLPLVGEDCTIPVEEWSSKSNADGANVQNGKLMSASIRKLRHWDSSNEGYFT